MDGRGQGEQSMVGAASRPSRPLPAGGGLSPQLRGEDTLRNTPRVPLARPPM